MRLDELVDASLMTSRADAAAFLIREGISKRQGTFDRISVKIDNIKKAEEELRQILKEG